jgi:hypothetical protein
MNTKNMATLASISQIQEEHLNHLEIDNLSQNPIFLNALLYDLAILAKAAHQVVLQSSDIMHKVKAKIQQAHNDRLSSELLGGETKFFANNAMARGLKSLI